MSKVRRRGKCYWCKGPMEPRPGKLFCSNACKQSAYRWRRRFVMEELVQLSIDLKGGSDAQE